MTTADDPALKIISDLQHRGAVRNQYAPHKGEDAASSLTPLCIVRHGGGGVAVQLVGKKVDSTVNNPIEAVAQWRANSLRPLCVFDRKQLPYTDKITITMSWGDLPICKSEGLDVEYLMLRGIFYGPGRHEGSG